MPQSKIDTEAQQPWDGGLDETTLSKLPSTVRKQIQAARREARRQELEDARTLRERYKPFSVYDG